MSDLSFKQRLTAINGKLSQYGRLDADDDPAAYLLGREIKHEWRALLDEMKEAVDLMKSVQERLVDEYGLLT